MQDLEFVKVFEDLFGSHIDNYYPFSRKELNTYADKLNWGKYDKFEFYESGISTNKNIKWSQELIDEFQSKISWDLLCLNEGIIWTLDFIKKNEANINIELLTQNSSFPWNNEAIRKFIFRIASKKDFGYLCRCKFIHWNSNLIREYIDKVEWSGLSINPNLHLTSEEVKEWSGHIEWEKLILNQNIDWSSLNVKSYLSSYALFMYSTGIDTWHWNLDTNLHASGLFKREDFPNNKGLLLNNGLNWSSEFIIENANSLNWEFICKNTNVEWNDDLIDTCLKYIQWGELSANRGVKWKESKILKYSNFIKFGTTKIEDSQFAVIFNLYGLDSNTSVIWTDDLIRMFAERWDWHQLLNNESIIWNKQLFEYHKSYILKVENPLNENLWHKIVAPIVSKYELNHILDITHRNRDIFFDDF